MSLPPPSRARPPPRADIAPSMGQRYEMRGELARGGMARVYRVFDRLTGEVRAMKRVSWDGTGSRFEVDSLEREYALLASLTHPRIIRVYDFGVDDNDRYYTMDLLDGHDMRKLSPLSVQQACLYLRDVATSLALLHARRMLHRDLSPSNVRATPDGHCKLIDFGALAAFGPSRVIVGTPPTIAPEALRGAALDQRTDLYSLGTLAYWMLTRRHAYPAMEIAELPAKWEHQPAPPSSYASGIPEELDTLVLSLLRANPQARPATAAEVIARLEMIGELPAEDTLESERLAQSFLLNPPFTGRSVELRQLEGYVAACRRGQGTALSVRAAAGLGRTRFIDEVALRAQIAGALVLRVDASSHRQPYGSARALVMNLLNAAPALAREGDGSALASLGLDLSQYLGNPSPISAALDSPPSGRRRPASPEAWLCALSRARPIVVAVDNVELADDASLGFLFGLAKLVPDYPLLLVVSERLHAEPRQALGLVGLREHSTRIDLEPLSAAETHALVLSMFDDAPNAERYAEWLYSVCGGNPLHAVEVCRQLAARRVIRYTGGLWSLPSERPEAELPSALGDALHDRISGLGVLARELAECLSLREEQPTLASCRELLPQVSEIAVRQRLDELALAGVLCADEAGYRFASTAIRDAVIALMDDERLKMTHRGLGEALAGGAGRAAPQVVLQAGWHLIQGGAEERGADLIASVACDYLTVCTMVAKLHRIGKPLEAALLVYNRYRRTSYERLPLLCSLAMAGWYEERIWGERHGDHALDAAEDLVGLATARRARRFLGAWPALLLGLALGVLRFWLTPRRERQYSLRGLYTQLLGSTIALAGAAAVALDSERVVRVAAVLEPFAILPEWSTPTGVYRFCLVLQALGRENPAQAYEDVLIVQKRFQNPRYFPALPLASRQLIVASTHFVRASLGSCRARGEGVQESAEALENMGFELYAMVGSQIQSLYHLLRGEAEQAAPYRLEVDLHAARTGTIWQVETWEAAALMYLHVNMLWDVVGTTRLLHRLEAAVHRVPSLGRYRQQARNAVTLLRGEQGAALDAMAAAVKALPPKSYLGWAGTLGFVARACNAAGQHARAIELCEHARAHTSEADREFVTLFLAVDIELALALGGLGEHGRGLASIDALLLRFADCSHPLVLGLLHEARATLCWKMGDVPGFSHSLGEVEHWFCPTGVPALVAKYDRLVMLSSDGTERPAAAGDGEWSSTRPEPLRGLDDEFGGRATAVEVVAGAEPDAKRARA